MKSIKAITNRIVKHYSPESVILFGSYEKEPCGGGSDAVVEREFGNLEKIRDNYEKIVISMDRFFPAERNGIIHRYVIDFLLE